MWGNVRLWNQDGMDWNHRKRVIMHKDVTKVKAAKETREHIHA